MPIHDCEGIIGPLYMQTKDGEFVPLASIQTAQLTDGECTYSNDLFSEGFGSFEFSITGRMTHRSARKFRKQFMADIHRISRYKRSMKRRKEKARRARLKGEIR